MATLYFLEYQKRSNIEWSTMASNGMLAIGPAHPSTMSTTSNYEHRYNSLLHSTLSPLYTKHGSYTRGLDGGLSVKSNSLTTPPPHTKQQLYSQEITWYPISHPGSQPKLEKNKSVNFFYVHYKRKYVIIYRFIKIIIFVIHFSANFLETGSVEMARALFLVT